MQAGFIINKLRLTGNSVENAEITLAPGANIISGPSNTGKTFVFQCINYMLGSSTLPKQIDEVKPYSSMYLEITSHEDITYTLKSDIKGGDFHIYQSKIDEITFDQKFDTLSRKHNPQSEKTISAFLLKLNNAYLKEIRTNAKGKTRQISYRDIVKFLLISEERMMTEASLIESHYTKGTEEKSVMKYIVSGSDDSNIITALSKSEIDNKRGRLALLKDLIKESEYDLHLMKKNLGNEQLEEITQSIIENKKIYETFNSNYITLTNERNSLIFEYETNSRQKRELEELLKRSSLLKNHYLTDTIRLKSTIEASVLLKDRKPEASFCPLCKNEIPHDCDANNIDIVIESCNAEIVKIDSLLDETEKSEKVINGEIQNLNQILENQSATIKEIEKERKDNLEIRLKGILEIIDSLNEKKNRLLGVSLKEAQLQKFISQKEMIENLLVAPKEVNEYESLTTANMFSVSNQLEIVLKGINYPELNAVSYSENKSDFVLDGQDRSLFGKGYRAIIYASFIVAIQELIYDKEYSIGIPVLDSPLVTYKRPNNENQDLIPIDLAMDFYRYISRNTRLHQIIIIENEEPPEDVLQKVNHIVFTQSKTNGRYGFIPN